jgi:hypothetical protein
MTGGDSALTLTPIQTRSGANLERIAYGFVGQETPTTVFVFAVGAVIMDGWQLPARHAQAGWSASCGAERRTTTPIGRVQSWRNASFVLWHEPKHRTPQNSRAQPRTHGRMLRHPRAANWHRTWAYSRLSQCSGVCSSLGPRPTTWPCCFGPCARYTMIVRAGYDQRQ